MKTDKHEVASDRGRKMSIPHPDKLTTMPIPSVTNPKNLFALLSNESNVLNSLSRLAFA